MKANKIDPYKEQQWLFSSDFIGTRIYSIDFKWDQALFRKEKQNDVHVCTMQTAAKER